MHDSILIRFIPCFILKRFVTHLSSKLMHDSPLHSLSSLSSRLACCLIMLLCATPVLSLAQRTLAYGVGIGTIYYYGDLTDVFASSQMKPAFSFSFQNYVSPNSSFRVGLSYGEIAATDAYANDQPRRTRNLHFRSDLWELQGVLMYEFIKDRNFGNEYILRPHFSPYLFGGMAAIWFNPEARDGDVWVPLQPLGTEGQTLPGGPGAYSRLQLAFPGGAGINLRLANYAGINAEIGYRLTLTDYLDDVSSYYPDLAALEAHNPLAAALSARPLEPVPYIATGEIRGNPKANDGYFFFMTTITFYLDRFYSRGRR